MQKLLPLLFGLLVLFGCKKKQDANEDAEDGKLVFEYQKMPDKTSLNPEATVIVENWKDFQKFNESIDVLYRATNNEDLILAIDDLIEKEKLLEEGTYPEMFNSLQIKSRQRVLKTYLYKVKSSILENQETTEPTVEMLEAYNALRSQLNSMVNSQLDKKLILDEE
ncbi:hypothetical protein [Flagellimonas nanhaiensis]|uniref:Uncharacterized protein n=1 Tax=Flagellimonas nanhaiensis TaxID=2292706 RepID=A0A371JRJ0_9FLAO|nr:hypothetical protein [Allomuricauda nanhaiensis]RDY60086.1 hypothetical protein DX873_12180 [Allomuricauda nanhaiensis]